MNLVPVKSFDHTGGIQTMRDIRLLAQRLPIPKGWKLSLNRSFLNSALDRAAKLATTDDERRSVDHDRWHELGMQEEEEQKHYTIKLIRQAARLWVPRPPMFDDKSQFTTYWAEMEMTGGHALTLAGAKMLRDDIRQEVRARHELWAHRILWVTALTGLLGAITGLVAVISKTH